MATYKDITGQKFGRLTAVFIDRKTANFRIYWMCHCDCGAKKSVRGDLLRSGATNSCGCLQKESVTTHGMTNSPTWRSWKSMHDRCNNRSYPGFNRYGGRGIKVCRRWSAFENFLSDMGTRPNGKTLDRRNNSGHYNKKNCQWATPRAQANNTSRNVVLTHDGKTMTLAQWARYLGYAYVTLEQRKSKGLPIHLVLRPKRIPITVPS